MRSKDGRWRWIQSRAEVAELSAALNSVKVLSGLVPVCAWCKRVRSDQGYWQQLEHFISERSHARFTHGMCPECDEKQSRP